MSITGIINRLFKLHLKRYQRELERIKAAPTALQQRLLRQILEKQARTAFGKQHRFKRIRDYSAFREAVPLHQYADMQPYLQRIVAGEPNVITSQKITWFAKTAGTTSGQSKYIPMTWEHIRKCHLKASWMILATLYAHRPDIRIFARKNMIFPGGVYGYYPGSDILVGDISAILTRSIPLLIRPFYIPDIYTATLPDWEKKVEIMAELLAKEPGLTMLGGVPTWNITLYRKVLEHTGARHLLEVWPDLQAYVHGGVSYRPYRAHFEELIPDERFLFLEAYNASEGFFAIQDDLSDEGLLLLLSNDIFFEFIPFEQYQRGDYGQAVDLTGVKKGKSYTLLITNSSGLYRYVVGDVVTFTSVSPYKIRIKGRTQEYINAFGEDLLWENAERALMKTCREYQAEINDYTVAPYYLNVNYKGRHQWFIEFKHPPASIAHFEKSLDLAMQEENSNYAQKRSNDLALSQLEVISLPPGFFDRWFKMKGKVGGQHKVPKLVNDRKYAQEFLSLLEEG